MLRIVVFTVFVGLTGLASLKQVVGSEADGPARRARVNGVELAYELQGSGEPLVLIHGGQGDRSSFVWVVP
jgi:hypothetical protein